jgi:hypothetical protein
MLGRSGGAPLPLDIMFAAAAAAAALPAVGAAGGLIPGAGPMLAGAAGLGVPLPAIAHEAWWAVGQMGVLMRASPPTVLGQVDSVCGGFAGHWS